MCDSSPDSPDVYPYKIAFNRPDDDSNDVADDIKTLGESYNLSTVVKPYEP